MNEYRIIGKYTEKYVFADNEEEAIKKSRLKNIEEIILWRKKIMNNKIENFVDNLSLEEIDILFYELAKITLANMVVTNKITNRVYNNIEKVIDDIETYDLNLNS